MNLIQLLIRQFIAFKLFDRQLILVFLVSGILVACVSQQQQSYDIENARARARAHNDLGSVYFQQRNFEVALEEFTIATKIDPTFGLAYNGLGMVHSALGQDDLAEKNFKQSIQIEPNNSESHNNFGSFLCSRGRIDESIKEFMAAVKNPLYATPAMAYTNAGICSLRKQDMRNAEAYFQRALQIEPLFHSAAYQLALIQFNRNDVTSAKTTLQNAMLSRPGPELLWLSVRIARLLGDRDDESSYALELRRQYPDSEQAKLLQSGNY
ncbi:MAG: type IV pilus biogenesis/stability protein PilW [Methylotenera sp.]|jgi:type IV pilus assembly protein PilF|uniref:type IV pilus biogenesis/stability protein PilW n=1 Tax=Methylotenera sp. TaxID=2051956 RepID=UPI00272042D1|nr:type IV pilus biogenesis/stability protein PilW [Methylotenera sp.]MDO9151154.1 type IV pilus biogenesis/stability protein PilW [Methylotenera sp.]